MHRNHQSSACTLVEGREGGPRTVGQTAIRGNKVPPALLTAKDREYFLPCVSLLEHTHVLPLEGNKFKECSPDDNPAHRHCCEFRENKKPNSDKALIFVIVKRIPVC